MKAITVVEPGPDSRLEIREVPTPVPSGREILVKIEAAALNRADLLQRKGNYPPPEGASDILGLEMTGIVESAGPDARRWEQGDSVFSLLAGGGYAEYCVVHEDMAMPVPEGLSPEEAAAVPETFLTAYQALSWLGRLDPGETALIHAGGSGVGTAAIQLARRLFNARVLTTAGKEEKLEACRGLGAEYAYNYRDSNFAEEIQHDIGDAAVDLVIDFVGAPYWERNLEVLGLDGRLVILSMLGGHRVETMSMVPILRKRLSIIGSTLRNRAERYKIELTREFSERTLELFEQGVIGPVIDSVYDWTEAEEAQRRMAENRNTGKIVLTGM